MFSKSAKKWNIQYAFSFSFSFFSVLITRMRQAHAHVYARAQTHHYGDKFTQVKVSRAKLKMP